MDEPNVIPFPPRPCAAGTAAEIISQQDATLVLVEHKGRVHLLPELMARLSPLKRAQVEAAVPRSGQEVWDMVVRSWPALADEIVVGCSCCNPPSPQ